MNLFSKTLLAGAALMLAPLSASALPPDCSQERCDGAPCWLVCAVPWGMKVITCEQWVTEYEYGTCVDGARDEEADESAALRQDEATDAESVCREPMLAARAAE
jgi:hypothetical protein